jgi:hypothetical protein
VPQRTRLLERAGGPGCARTIENLLRTLVSRTTLIRDDRRHGLLL